ncbi:hypothetical protein EOL96_08555 [Candidatus Saccharibacteria bacterium]|nr:hypothetical protein [Candidatus Saccharibacteria bacterium]
MNVAIQGNAGSFHHEAAQQWFGNDVDIIECASFSEVFHRADTGSAEIIVTAVENTLYGSINEVYQLIEELGWPIVGEIKLAIEHQLIALPNTELSAITTVYSHSVALAQCRHTIEALLPRATMVEYFDTAGAVEFIRDTNNPSYGAIASRTAAKLFELPIIAENIHDNEHNATRFVVLAKNALHQQSVPNRTSMVLVTNHQPGALANALSIFAAAGINLVKLQSQPIIGSAWQYKFFIVADSAGAELDAAVAGITAAGHTVRVLGSYQAA